jgi:hypothetical protein
MPRRSRMVHAALLLPDLWASSRAAFTRVFAPRPNLQVFTDQYTADLHAPAREPSNVARYNYVGFALAQQASCQTYERPCNKSCQVVVIHLDNQLV